MPFHQQLKLERERRGWSQADLAKRIGTNVKSITRWENGKSLPQPYYRQAFSKLFGKSLEELGMIEYPQESGRDSKVEDPPHKENWGEAPDGNAFYRYRDEQASKENLVANAQIAEGPEFSLLKEARLERGWTQTKLAAMIGVSDRAYRAWENGDAYPSDLLLRRLTKVFGKRPVELGLEKRPKTSLTYTILSQALQELVKRNTQWAHTGLHTEAEKKQMVDMLRQLLLEIEAGHIEKVAERFDQAMLAQDGQSQPEEGNSV